MGSSFNRAGGPHQLDIKKGDRLLVLGRDGKWSVPDSMWGGVFFLFSQSYNTIFLSTRDIVFLFLSTVVASHAAVLNENNQLILHQPNSTYVVITTPFSISALSCRLNCIVVARLFGLSTLLIPSFVVRTTRYQVILLFLYPLSDPFLPSYSLLFLGPSTLIKFLSSGSTACSFANKMTYHIFSGRCHSTSRFISSFHKKNCLHYNYYPLDRPFN